MSVAKKKKKENNAETPKVIITVQYDQNEW